MRAAIVTTVLFAFLTTPDSRGQELVTDRPDQTESSATVPPNRWQIETGVLFEDDEAGDTVSAPGTLLRIGLQERLELRLGWGGWIRRDTDGGDPFDGPADGELGIKVRLLDGDQRRPELALLAGTSLPWGDDAFTSDRFDPSVRLAATRGVAPGIDLAVNLGAEWESTRSGGDTDTLSRALATAALGFEVAPDLGAFVELFGTTPLSARGDDALSADAGFTWLVRPNLQLDVAAGAGLEGEAPDAFVGVGVTYRWPR